LVQNGEIYYGSSALAGELGHIPVEGIDIPCSCGNIGCLETVVSATGIARQAREKVEQGAAGLLSERFAENPAAITAFDVSQACREGDALAAEILADTGKTLGKALAYLVPILSPDVIVVGGGAAQAGPPLFDPLREALYSRLLSFYKERCKLAAAQLGDDAGVIGSAMRALQLSAKRSGS
jgi:glucokinase